MSAGHQPVTGNINWFNNAVNLNRETDAERQRILQWLSPLKPQQRHRGLRTERLKGVGNWVLETNEFRKWSDTEDGRAGAVLFCYGNPGVGKTYLSSLVIDNLCDRARGKDIAVVGLYCDFHAQREQSSASMLGAILKQLMNRGELPENIREAFQKAKKEFGGRGLLPPDLVEILKNAIALVPRVFICIDALDESAARHRRELLESLGEIVRVSTNTRIFLTGRPHIDDEIMKYFSGAVRIRISPTQNDIRSYLGMRLAGDTDPNAMDDELRGDIMRVIPEKSSDIFLLVSLNIGAILGEITLDRRRKMLEEMTKGRGLGDAYAAILSRIKEQKRSRSRLGMDVLMWLSHAERPLHVEELCHALGVEEGSVDLNIQNIPAIETLLACSLGLVTVEKSSSTVRLVHCTLQEYLTLNHSLFLKPHSMIAEVCLTYLNFRQVRSLSPTHTFVLYASCYWGEHARRETTESVKTLALKLLDGYDNHISSTLLLFGRIGWDCPFGCKHDSGGFTGLHGAAYFGCEEITVALLKMNKWGAQTTDFHGNTAIAWAARKGHQGIVRILLERNDVNPNTTDIYRRTPLLWAAQNGHEGVVRILLERNDVNPNTTDIYGRTPLLWAAENGDGEVVRMLLRRYDVNPNTTDTKYGQTPLSWAAEKGHEGVVAMLLERNDVNPNITDTQYGQTPLSWAAENGHQGVVRMLLGRHDVNPNTTDTQYGQTPLSWAAGSGHEGVVRVLLESGDCNTDTADTQCGRTPLSWAAGNGHEGVVRMLLKRYDVNPNTTDTQYGQTPLSWASRNGHKGVVRILLERNDINPNTADTKYGRTPLLWAAESGHEGVVRILLQWDDVNPNTADICGRTPLSWASRNGHKGVVRILLERNDLNPNTADTKYGQTPLSWAAEKGHEGVVSMLLERNDVNPDIADTGFGQTPLMWAARNGHEGIVSILLERNDVNPDPADIYGRTPLRFAAQNGYARIVKLLQERMGLIPRYIASLPSPQQSLTEPYKSSEPPSKRARWF